MMLPFTLHLDSVSVVEMKDTVIDNVDITAFKY